MNPKFLGLDIILLHNLILDPKLFLNQIFFLPTPFFYPEFIVCKKFIQDLNFFTQISFGPNLFLPKMFFEYEFIWIKYAFLLDTKFLWYPTFFPKILFWFDPESHLTPNLSQIKNQVWHS